MIRSAVALLALVLAAAPAHGEAKREKEHKLLEQGRRAYNLGHWSDALADFEKAYETSGDAALLFNLAETHRQLGHTSDALRLYNEYLRELPNGPDREAAETAIKQLGGTAAPKATPPPTAPPQMAAPKPTAPPPVSPPPVAATPPKPAPPPVAATSPKPAPPPPAPAPAPSKPLIAKAPTVGTTPSPAQPAATTTPPPPVVPIAPRPASAPSPQPPAAAISPPPPSIAPPLTATSPPLATGPPTLVGQPPPPKPYRSKWPVIAGAAATGAFAVGALAFTLSSDSLYNSLKASCGGTGPGCSASQIDTVRSRDHAATAFWLLTGAAAVATSVLLVIRF